MNEPSINITVLLFGACREAAGVSEMHCDLAAPATAATAWAAVAQRFPSLARFERSALVAINEAHAGREQSLHNGDTLAIFPPVSGG